MLPQGPTVHESETCQCLKKRKLIKEMCLECHQQTLLKCFVWFIAEIKNVNCPPCTSLSRRRRRFFSRCEKTCETATSPTTSDCLNWLCTFINKQALQSVLSKQEGQSSALHSDEEGCCALWIKQTTNCFVFASVEISKAVPTSTAPNHTNNSASS